MSEIRLSVVIPVYNVAEYIDNCMESVLKQDMTGVEIILVDDGATDNCPQICDEYAAKYENVSVIHKINGGLSSARNAGLKVAIGEYVYFLDSDDWIDEKTLEVIKPFMKEGYDLIKFGYKICGKSEVEVQPTLAAGLYRKNDLMDKILLDAISPNKISSHNFMLLSVWSHVYRRAFLEEHKMEFVSERRIGSEDYLFNLQAYTFADSMMVLNDYLYCYYQREGSLTKQYRKNLFERYCNLIDEYEKHLKANNIFQLCEKRFELFVIRSMWYVCITNECKLEDNILKKENISKALKYEKLRNVLKKYHMSLTDIKGSIFLYCMKYQKVTLIMKLKK